MSAPLVIDGQTVVCTDCATKYGSPTQELFSVWFDVCQICGATEAPCVRAEDFKYLPLLPAKVKMQILMDEVKGIGEDG